MRTCSSVAQFLWVLLLTAQHIRGSSEQSAVVSSSMAGPGRASSSSANCLCILVLYISRIGISNDYYYEAYTLTQQRSNNILSNAKWTRRMMCNACICFSIMVNIHREMKHPQQQPHHKVICVCVCVFLCACALAYPFI